MAKRLLPACAMSVVMCVAAALSLGMPDWNALGAFFNGNSMTNAAVISFAVLIVWGVILAFAVGVIVSAFREASQTAVVQQTWSRIVIFFVAGVLLCALGLAHHTSRSFSMCCGNSQQLVQEVQSFGQ